MRSYEVEHEQNAWNLGTGMFLGATALTSCSLLLAVNRLFDVKPVVNPALTVLVALCIGFAMGARTSMVDLWRTMEHNTRLAVTVLLVAYFGLAGLAPGRWTPLAGMAALHLPAVLTLVSERGFARLYLLVCLTTCFSVIGWNPSASTYILAVVALLLFFTLTYETFFFRVIAQPVSTRINAWLPAGLALGRYLLFAAPAFLLWRVAPSPRPFLLQPGNAPVEEKQRTYNPQEFNGNLLEAFLYTMGLVLLLLGLIAFLRYLHSKFRRKRGEVLPESIGVPVMSPQRMAREGKRRRGPRADDPLEQIVKEYERFSTSLKSERAHRDPSQTPQEFATSLRNIAALPGTLVGDITQEFSSARYATELVTWKTAEHFSALIDRAIQSEEYSVEET